MVQAALGVSGPSELLRASHLAHCATLAVIPTISFGLLHCVKTLATAARTAARPSANARATRAVDNEDQPAVIRPSDTAATYEPDRTATTETYVQIIVRLSFRRAMPPIESAGWSVPP